MNLRSIIVTVIIAGSVTYLFSLVPPVEGKGGSKGSGSRPGGSRPGSSRPTNSKPSYTPSKGVSSKGFGAKKVVAFAAGAYIGGKVAKKIGKKFNKGLKFGDDDFDFDDWDREARVDGWICRNDQDCSWIDDHLACDDRDFSSSRLNGNWPATFKQDARGHCACEFGYTFDSDEAECQKFSIDGTPIIYIAIAIVVSIIVGLCCCIGVACFFCKMIK